MNRGRGGWGERELVLSPFEPLSFFSGTWSDRQQKANVRLKKKLDLFFLKKCWRNLFSLSSIKSVGPISSIFFKVRLRFNFFSLSWIIIFRHSQPSYPQRTLSLSLSHLRHLFRVCCTPTSLPISPFLLITFFAFLCDDEF